MGETDRQEVLSKLIQKLVKEKREPYLLLRVFNEETMEKLIPYKRGISKEVSFIEYTFYNTTSKKMKQLTFTITNFISKKIGFEWVDAELEFLYTVKISTGKEKKLIRKMTTGKKQENYFF